MTILWQTEARCWDYGILLPNDLKVLYSAQYHRQHYTLQAFEQFGAFYMHNLDDKHPTRPEFEPSTSEFRSTTGLNKAIVAGHAGTYVWVVLISTIHRHTGPGMVERVDVSSIRRAGGQIVGEPCCHGGGGIPAVK